ncbi:cytochrome P450 [Streptomyces sindenensis]|uniref:cytochrome P450 n=1 Tax=Streptomyces sindenensis TaxID=67363 RepID=UPI001671CEE5|nr:cytochrome P450 [Streptomyces sindenensis]GGP83435.1 cytochrome P450 [Streptomyces sindenensis]
MKTPTRFLAEDLGTVNLADPATYHSHDLAGYWRTLRTERPVFRHSESPQGPPFWVISRYADVMNIYRDGDRFVSAKGNLLTTLLNGGDSAAGKMLAVTDGTRHREVRKVLLKAFSPKKLDQVADRVRRNTRARVASVVERGSCDFASDVAVHIPMTTICDLLGVPEEDRDMLLKLNKSALSSDDPDATEDDERMARNQILMYFSELAEERREDPQDDVISALATATIDGKELTEDEIVFNCYSLIIGGDETSRLSMIGGVQAFTEFPDQWEALRTGAVSVESATEEILRWVTPTMHFGRVARYDTVLHGELIKAGDPVTLWHSSANFDEETFGDPYRFDLARTPNKHVTFGYGPHFCLGAYLARVEIAALLTNLVEMVSRIDLSGEVVRIHSNFLSGISGLPVMFTPSGAFRGV